MQRLIFVNRYFYPDHSATSQMLSDLAFALAAGKREVHVVTSRLRYDDPTARLAAGETVSGVTVHRVWTTRFGRGNLILRALDYATFYLSAAWRLWRLARRGDIVVAKTDPPMLSVVAAPVARLRRAHLVNWLQDVYPEVAAALLGQGSRLATVVWRLLKPLRNWSLRRAAANVVLGERMADLVTGNGIPPELQRVIQNWSDERLVRPVEPEANALRRAWGLDGAFVVGYSGNLGRSHEVDALLDAMTRTARDASRSGRPIRWLMIGGGAQFAGLKAEAEARGLRGIVFQPYQPRERLAESLSAADVHLVSLRLELEGLIVPSKVYGVLAAGRPAIFIGDRGGEVARLLARHEAGVTVPPSDGAALADTVFRLEADPEATARMGAKAREASVSALSRAEAFRRWEALLDAIDGPPASAQ